MTPRERILGTLLGQKVDRTPYGVGIGFGPWGETVDRWKRESGMPDLNIYEYFGYEPGFIGVPVNMGAWPPFAREVITEDENSVTTRDPRGMIYRNLKKSCSMPDFIDYPVHNRQEWDQYKAQRLRPDAPGRFLKPGNNWNLWNDVAWQAGTAEEAVKPIAGQAAREGLPVQVGTFPWGVFGTARDMLGAEELLIAFYTDPEMVHDIMDTFTDLWVGLYEQVARYVRIDHIHIWEDMSGKQGSLISPAMIEDFMMPNYRKIRDFARRHNVPMISVDSDGLVDDLIPIMMANGMNVMFPFEVQAGCDIEKYRREYPTLGIWGGLNKYALVRGRDAIDAELAKARRMLKHGRYIPGLDHLVPPDVSWDAWVYYNKRLKEIMGV